jgi:hypothetical protein
VDDVFTTAVLDVVPAAIVTVAGTVAWISLELRLTVAPAGPAAKFSAMVAVDVAPPATLDGLRAMLLRIGAFTVSCEVFEPPAVAVMVTFVSELTAIVVAVKVALVCPDGIVTVAGTVAADPPELSWT